MVYMPPFKVYAGRIYVSPRGERYRVEHTPPCAETRAEVEVEMRRMSDGDRRTVALDELLRTWKETQERGGLTPPSHWFGLGK